MPREFYYKWILDLEAAPEALWPLVSDTNRFNRDTGLPPMELLGFRNGVKRVRYKIPVYRVEWNEEPFEWIYPYRYGILRRYVSGPLAELRVDCHLERREPSGTRLTYETWAVPNGLLGYLAIPIGIGKISAHRFENVFRTYDRLALNRNFVRATLEKQALSSESRNRLKVQSERLRNQGADPGILTHLQEFLDHADDLSIQRMRPYALADGWDLPRRAVLETFLRATRLGILDMYWDILCPECRGVSEDLSSLSNVGSRSHCDTCQIDFTTNFDHNVEVIFRPNPSVRPVDVNVEFCVGSPQRQPHIMFSYIVPECEELPLDTMLMQGRYMLRASGLPGSQAIIAKQDGPISLDVRADDSGWPTGLTEIGLSPKVRLINKTDQARTFDLIHTAWSDQASTAADVTILQVFRDLFASEVIRPGEQISVGSVCLMFTDLRGSTRLYRQMGDATAFSRVREHFKILERAVSDEGGSIIKTMGDSVMAAFRQPAQALQAIWNAQKFMATTKEPALWLKVGIHHGPCIVVNMNERLDYFGSTVNVAARLSDFSIGGEVIFSEWIRNDMAVQEFLEKNVQPNALTRFETQLRGYDEPVSLWKMKM